MKRKIELLKAVVLRIYKEDEIEKAKEISKKCDDFQFYKSEVLKIYNSQIL